MAVFPRDRPSPGGGDTHSVGPVQRLGWRDSREIPSIQITWVGAVPIVHAAAGVQRVCALAYVLTWVWKEHRLVAGHMGEPTGVRDNEQLQG